MKELETLVIRAQKGEGSAYGTLIQRFQEMAVGYAYAILGDLHLAEDVTQEAFLEAYRHLPSLRDPAAFPGWFRRIVFTQINRLKRNGKVSTLSLDDLTEASSAQPGPMEVVEKREAQATIFEAIQSLPEPQRTVITLFYINEYSQKEISAFLEIPVATVKTRLYATSSVKDMTPLHLAVWLSAGDELFIRPELPRLLLEQGAETEARDSERKMTPLEWAEARHEDEEKDRTEVVTLLRQYQ